MCGLGRNLIATIMSGKGSWTAMLGSDSPLSPETLLNALMEGDWRISWPTPSGGQTPVILLAMDTSFSVGIGGLRATTAGKAMEPIMEVGTMKERLRKPYSFGAS